VPIASCCNAPATNENDDTWRGAFAVRPEVNATQLIPVQGRKRHFVAFVRRLDGWSLRQGWNLESSRTQDLVSAPDMRSLPLQISSQKCAKQSKLHSHRYSLLPIRGPKLRTHRVQVKSHRTLANFQFVCNVVRCESACHIAQDFTFSRR